MGSSGECSSGGGPQSAPFWRRVRRALAPRSLETRGVPSPGAGPYQNGTCFMGDIGSKIRAGRSTANFFRFGRPESVYAIPYAPSERMGSLGIELQQALVSWCAPRPPSRLLAHSGARYEVSDLREIYGAARRNSAGSSGGVPRAAGRSPSPSHNVCAEPLRLKVLRNLEASPRRGRAPARSERV